MSDEAKALVERLRDGVLYGDARLHNPKGHDPLRMEAADLIETQAREIERLSYALRCTPQARHGAIIYDCGDPWEILNAALAGDSHE